VPELDYAVLGEYVRVEGGLANMIAAGIDTVYAPQVPTGHNLGLLLRIGFARVETERPHRIEVIFQDEDGERLAHITGVITPEWNEDLPPGWRVGSFSDLNFGVPLPRYGLYSFEILINDNQVKSIPLRVVPPPGQAPEA
jgi:hypothetical protein